MITVIILLHSLIYEPNNMGSVVYKNILNFWQMMLVHLPCGQKSMGCAKVFINDHDDALQ